MFSLRCKLKELSRNWCKFRESTKTNKALLGCVILCFCVYLTLSLTLYQTDGEKYRSLQRFHQFYLKGDWILIPTELDEGQRNVAGSTTVRPNSRRRLCHTFVGRLGNKMFQYAFIYALSRNSVHDLVMSSSYDLADVFSNLAVSFTNFRPCLLYTKLFEGDPYRYESAIAVLPNDTDFLLEGFLQSWKYFEPYKCDLLQQFTFRNHITQQAEQSLNTALQDFRNYRNVQHAIGTYANHFSLQTSPLPFFIISIGTIYGRDWHQIFRVHSNWKSRLGYFQLTLDVGMVNPLVGRKTEIQCTTWQCTFKTLRQFDIDKKCHRATSLANISELHS